MPRDALLDELMAEAWPALEEERRGPWRYRWTRGVTRRANSVLAVGSDAQLEKLVAMAEGFYAQRGAPALFLVSSASAPVGMAAYLRERGYTPEARTLVMTASPPDVALRRSAVTWEVRTATSATDAWFDAYWSVEGLRGRSAADALVCRSVLLNCGLPQLFASIEINGTVVAVGQAVFSTGWCGVQCMATRPADRQQGLASALLATLASRAVQQGNEGVYLAVQADNQRALPLYKGSGFGVVHEYEYWRQSVPPGTVDRAWPTVR